MSINNFTASGNLGGDCEQRVTPSGKYVSRFSLPVKQGFGEHEKTSWLSCKLFGGAAEKLPQYLTKGIKVVVSGEYVTEEWNGNDGTKHIQPTILVRNIEIASAGQQSGNSGNFNQQQNNSGQQRQPQQGGFNNQPQQSGGFNNQNQQAANNQTQRGFNNQQVQQTYNEQNQDFDQSIPF